MRYLLLGNDDADESRSRLPGLAGAVVDDQPAAAAAHTVSYCGEEILTPQHSVRGREHLRRRDARGPCDGAQREQLGQHECSCACGSRAPWHGDGCSAGRSAYSRVYSWSDDRNRASRGSRHGRSYRLPHVSGRDSARTSAQQYGPVFRRVKRSCGVRDESPDTPSSLTVIDVNRPAPARRSANPHPVDSLDSGPVDSDS